MVLAATARPRPARIETTLDAQLQADVAGIIRSHRAVLERHGAANVAVVVLDNARGEWLAWEGSGDYGDVEHGGAINGAIVAAAAGVGAEAVHLRARVRVGLHARERAGRRAVALSRPPKPASSTARATTTAASAARCWRGARWPDRRTCRRSRWRRRSACRRCCASSTAPASRRSIATPSYYGLGLTLGNAEVRLDELVAAYAAFARGGEWLAPTWLAAEAGAPRSRERRSVVSPRTAFWITDILSDAEAREFIFGRGGSLEFPFPVAVKTGTSQAYHDNWTIGYTRDVTVGVWVGNFDRTPLRDLDRRHRRGADLPRRDARGGEAMRRTRPAAADRPGARRSSRAARSARCPGCRPTPGARPGSASECCRPASRPAAGTTSATIACSWSGRRSIDSGRGRMA